MDKRIKFLVILFTAIFSVISFKAFYEQIINGYTYAGKSLEIRTEQLATEEYCRGDILDCNGVSLTDSAYRPVLIIFPKLLKNPLELKSRFANEMPELKIKKIMPTVKNGQKYYPDPFFIKLEGKENYGKIIDTWNEPGVTILPIKTRYGVNSLAEHIVGYVGFAEDSKSIAGIKGIERICNDYLRGDYPENIITPITDARYNFLEGLGYRNINLKKDEKRKDVMLTIDSRIQRIVEDIMDESNVKKGAVVILNVDNGSIMAAASRPSFDQNYPVDKKSSEMERVFNKGYPPGSIFKVITAAAVLEEGIVEPEDTYICEGFLPDVHVGCPREHGELNFAEAMQRSCNITFVRLGLMLGKERLEEYFNKFGFHTVEGKKLNSVEARANGIIGQEYFLVSPMEIANLMATIARNGYHQDLGDNAWENRLLKSINKEGKIVKNFSQVPEFRNVYGEKTASQLQRMLLETNKFGSGSRAWLPEYGSAGKTGTPELGNNEYLAWYAGYAPVEKPKYAVAVLIEEIKNLNKSELQGGRHAAPIFKKILKKTLELNL